MKKLLVWDGDETLWDGTIAHGDDIELPEGRFEQCEELFNRGVVQSIASHNDLEDVERAIHKFGLTNFFLLPQAEFGLSKSVMISKIQDKLGLAKCSDIVFVDDWIHNLEEVNYSLPDVITCYPSELPEVIVKHFTKESYTEEDRNRVRMYRSELLREESGKSYEDNKMGFLKSLGLKMIISNPSEYDMPRVLDLIHRANRFSAKSREFTDGELLGNMNNLLVIRVSDNFGDYGLSGVALLLYNEIHLFVISCRLQGKGLGSSFLGSIMNMFVDMTICAEWVETEYNGGMKSLYDWYGFNVLNDVEYPRMSLGIHVNKSVELPSWVEVVNNAKHKIL